LADYIRHIWERHSHLLVLTAVLIAGFFVLYALRTVLLPFFLGFLMAYLLMPLISWIEKRLPHQGRWLEAKRTSIILLFYLVILAVIGVITFVLFGVVSNAFATLVENAPQYYVGAVERLQQWTETVRQMFPEQIRDRVDSYVLQIGDALVKAVNNALMKSLTLIPVTIGLLIGLASIPLFLFYVLKDREKLSYAFYASLPHHISDHMRDIMSIVEKVLGRYICAALTLGLIVGVMDLAGLLLLRVPFAPMLAIVAAATELVPTIGPWIGAAVAIVVTLAVAPSKVIGVAILFLAVQLLEIVFLVPRIQSHYMKLHPSIVIVLLVLGAYLAGFWGLLLAVPLTATVVEVYRYFGRAAAAEGGGALPLP